MINIEIRITGVTLGTFPGMLISKPFYLIKEFLSNGYTKYTELGATIIVEDDYLPNDYKLQMGIHGIPNILNNKNKSVLNEIEIKMIAKHLEWGG